MAAAAAALAGVNLLVRGGILGMEEGLLRCWAHKEQGWKPSSVVFRR